MWPQKTHWTKIFELLVYGVADTVSGTRSNFCISIEPKPFYESETKTYLFSFFQNVSNFIMFFCFFREYKLLKTWKWTQFFKNQQKSLTFGRKFGFKGPIYTLSVNRFFLKCGFGYGMYRPILVSILVSVSDLNQNSNFSCSQHWTSNETCLDIKWTVTKGSPFEAVSSLARLSLQANSLASKTHKFSFNWGRPLSEAFS